MLASNAYNRYEDIHTNDTPAPGNESKMKQWKKKRISHNSRNDLFMDSCFSFVVGDGRKALEPAEDELRTNWTEKNNSNELVKNDFYQ